MGFLTDTFNNRELATIIWAGGFFAWALSKAAIRSSVKDLTKAFLSITVPLLLMLVYVFGLIYVFRSFGLWKVSNLKDTILWFVGGALVMLVIKNKAGKDKFFRNTAISSVALIVVLEFVVNLYVFKFWIEMITVPLMTLVFAMKAMAELDRQYKIIERFLESIMMIYGVAVLLFTVFAISADFSEFATLETLKSFLLPPVLTVCFLPFIYIFALFATYQSVFVRLGVFNDDRELLRYAKKRIIIRFHANLRGLSKWNRRVGSMKMNVKNDIHALLGC
jgi:hypothetical protein